MRSRTSPIYGGGSSPTRAQRERLAALIEERVASAATGWGTDAYGVLKSVLNALIQILARELAPRRIRVNATCPGWVRTDMGSSA